MAEILLSLTIIGVVAAITLPSLTGNINERTWNTQRKALYARMSQAMSLMPSLNGYGTLTAAVEADDENGVDAKDAVDTAAETFITEGLSKVLKINNICDNEHLSDCGVPENINKLTGGVISFPIDLHTLNDRFNYSVQGVGSYSQLNVKAAAFETQNGESIVVYYNPACQSFEISGTYVMPKMCANFVYDLNGNKGPNTVGKDIGFITVLYPSDPVVVAPMPLANNAGSNNFELATQLCKTQDTESRLPNRDELAAIFFNKDLLGYSGTVFWSSTIASSTTARGQSMNGFWGEYPKSQVNAVRCIKR